MGKLNTCKESNYRHQQHQLGSSSNDGDWWSFDPRRPRKYPEVKVARIVRTYRDESYRVYVTRLKYTLHAETFDNESSELYRSGTLNVAVYYDAETMELDRQKTTASFLGHFPGIALVTLGEKTTEQAYNFKPYQMVTRIAAVATLASMRLIKLNLLLGDDDT